MTIAVKPWWTYLLAMVALALSPAGCSGDDDDPVDRADGGADAGLNDAGDRDGGGIEPRFEPLATAIGIDLANNNATAASVAVWVDDEVVWVGGFGQIEGESGLVDEDTLFMIGSDTKKIAALGLLRHVEAGDATLETRVAEVLPDLHMTLAPEFLDATIHDLISHQGGIVDGVEQTTEADDEGLVNFVYGRFADFFYPLAPPGRIWNYSNPNFSVAGLMNQEIDGRPWADIVEEDIFAPLGMTRSFARKSEVDDNRATGVGTTANDPTIGEVSFEDTWESAFVRPAGLVWSTPGDQMRLAAFLVDGDESVLGDDLREALCTQQVPFYPDLPGGYGYGLMIHHGISLHDGYHDVPLWTHGGNTTTHTSTFYILPEQRFAISILSNGLGDAFNESVATAVETLVDMPAPVEGPSPPFDADALDDLVGSYFDDFNAGELIISRNGDALRVDAPQLDDLEIPYQHAMRALSTRVWVVNAQGQDLDFAFIDGPDGETYMRNRALVAIRPAPEADPRHISRRPAQRVTPRLDASTLREVLRRGRLDPTSPLLSPLVSPLGR